MQQHSEETFACICKWLVQIYMDLVKGLFGFFKPKDLLRIEEKEGNSFKGKNSYLKENKNHCMPYGNKGIIVDTPVILLLSL